MRKSVRLVVDATGQIDAFEKPDAYRNRIFCARLDDRLDYLVQLIQGQFTFVAERNQMILLGEGDCFVYEHLGLDGSNKHRCVMQKI